MQALYICLTEDHDLWLVALAAFICCLGTVSGFALGGEAFRSSDRKNTALWGAGAVIATSSAIWATHFISMLAYNAPLPITFDIARTVWSYAIAVGLVGIGATIILAAPNWILRMVGAGFVGLAISAMHYTGMSAYKVPGALAWDIPTVAVSVSLGVLFTAMAAHPVFWRTRARRWIPPLLFVLAVCAVHFLGMTAFEMSLNLENGVLIDTVDTNLLVILVANVVFSILGLSLAALWLALRDRRAQRSHTSKMLHMAHTDALTGLANRFSFSEALDHRYKEPDPHFALLTVDLDRFKTINDTLGHHAGDVLLRRVGARLRHLAGEQVLVARLGGDEFAIIADNHAGRDESRILAEQVNDLLCRPFIIDGHVLEIGASVGIALAPIHGKNAEELTRSVDLALYAAKQQGANTFRFFENDMSMKAQAKRALELDLRRALVRGEFELYYQPQVDSRTGKLGGAEALLRWHHAERGMISPADFIPLSEELGLINGIGEWVLREACTEAMSWPSHMTISVNLSPVQLRDPRLVSRVLAILEETGLAPSRLELELTETALMQDDRNTSNALHELCARGIRISMDDFGTGYSSLSYLRRYPFSKLKIDQSFIRQIPDDPDSVAIVQAVATLGNKLGMTVTVEGVETAEQRLFATREGCDQLQGYLIGKPMPASAFRHNFTAPQTARAS